MLAPMSGITDPPFRQLAHGLGAGWVVSEMVASEHLVRDRHGARRRLKAAAVSPQVVQLAGCEAHWMAEGARMAAAYGADIIDINMGCPARQVTGKQAGSALMRDLDHAQRLIAAVVGAVGHLRDWRGRLCTSEDAASVLSGLRAFYHAAAQEMAA